MVECVNFLFSFEKGVWSSWKTGCSRNYSNRTGENMLRHSFLLEWHGASVANGQLGICPFDNYRATGIAGIEFFANGRAGNYGHKHSRRNKKCGHEKN